MSKSYLIKHVIASAIIRIIVFLFISFEGASVFFDQYSDVRNEVYGIGHYFNNDFVSNMIILLNAVFLIAIIVSCWMRRKTLYTTQNIEKGNLKELVVFETILESSVAIGFVLLTSVLSIFIDNLYVKVAFLVHRYFFYNLTGNLLAATIVSVVIYLLVIFVIVVLPYVRLLYKGILK